MLHKRNIFKNLKKDHKQSKVLRIEQHAKANRIVQPEDIWVAQSLKWGEQVLFHVSRFDLVTPLDQLEKKIIFCVITIRIYVKQRNKLILIDTFLIRT